jgi:hypothetical protein
MLAKTVKPPTAWRDVNNKRNITESKAEGRPATARMPQIAETTDNSTSISRDANSTKWTPTTPEISRKFAKKLSERRKIHEETGVKFPIFGPIDFSNSDSIRSPMYLVQ